MLFGNVFRRSLFFVTWFDGNIGAGLGELDEEVCFKGMIAAWLAVDL
jgi:hypothetical protein